MSLTPGIRLGPYEILSALGAGGMGEVYQARDTRLVRDVAIKVLPPAFASESGHLARFDQEARAAAALNHPNIRRSTSLRHPKIPSHRPPTHPGEILLEEFLRLLGMTQIGAAAQMGISLSRLNELIRGKRGVTADTALLTFLSSPVNRRAADSNPA